MLTDLDKKLKIKINAEIKRKNNKNKFNNYNLRAISVGWVFILNIFLFITMGYFIKKYIISSNIVFIFIVIMGIILSFYNLFDIIKSINKENKVIPRHHIQE